MEVYVPLIRVSLVITPCTTCLLSALSPQVEFRIQSSSLGFAVSDLGYRLNIWENMQRNPPKCVANQSPKPFSNYLVVSLTRGPQCRPQNIAGLSRGSPKNH